jgi:exportin-7
MYSSAPARTAIIGVLRDLRGITAATYNKRTYNLLFDSLYPAFFPLFNRIAETWFNDPTVMTALLKFMQVTSSQNSNSNSNSD